MPHAAFYVVQRHNSEKDEVIRLFQCRTRLSMWCNFVTRIRRPMWGETAFWKVTDFFGVYFQLKQNIRFKITIVSIVFPFCDAGCTDLENVNDRMRLCASAVILSMSLAPWIYHSRIYAV